MQQRSNPQSIYNEDRLSLAVLAIEKGQLRSERHAAAVYDIPRSTLQLRRAGTTLRRDCEPNSKKLTKLEESVIIQHVLDLDLWGFPPRLGAVKNMTNQLLAARSTNQVGIK